jgi:formylglycine-generating enzyme required for sulfatase activity/predicted Ser/Thr protein kinase
MTASEQTSPGAHPGRSHSSGPSCTQAGTACTVPGDSMVPFHPGSPETHLPTGDLDLDAEAVLRAVAYAPPRRLHGAVAPGTRWSESGRYIINRRLGHGGMGTVYAATDTVLGRVVALKVLDVAEADQDAARHARLLREAQLAARVEHERIARVYDVGAHEGFAFVAMEYVPGGTLRQWMRRRDRPPLQIVDIVTQIAEGLAELHANGVIHRDLKPENVMLTAQGGIKLLDFGLARGTVVPAEEPGAPARTAIFDGASAAAVCGTPGYMAPEQCMALPIDARVDIFALGVILYELVTGERLFQGATVAAIMAATIEGAPVLRGGAWAHVPERLRDHTARMLAIDPAARFADGSAVLAALRELTVAMSPPRPRLTAASTQAHGKALTQPALALLPGRATWSGVARRVVRAALIVALLGFVRPSYLPPALPPSPPPPPGMVRVDVGTIDVGRHLDELERECREIGAGCDRTQMLREAPRVNVEVPPFYLDQHEVTNQQFVELLNGFAGILAVADDQDHHYPRYVHRNAGTGSEDVLIDLNKKYGDIELVDGREFRVRAGRAQLPVSLVSWFGAKLFCEAQGKRLPTEDEWEAAARGREDRRFPWGNDGPRCGAVVVPNDGAVPMSSRGWLPCVKGNAVPARVVGTAVQDVTPEGIHDLGGSVAEWTSSWFVEGNRAAHLQSAPYDAPRILRGGSWGSSLMSRSSGRKQLSPVIMGQNLGFRCASNAADSRP